jgi:hypothetical protein
MAEPRTIDNLGPEASNRFALNQQISEQNPYLKETSPYVPSQTTIDVTIPSYTSENDKLFELEKKNVTWATFPPPPNYNIQKPRIFMHQIVPSIGSEDRIEMQQQRISAASVPSTSSDREKREEEIEKKTLINTLQTTMKLDKDQVYINSHRDQYHKG